MPPVRSRRPFLLLVLPSLLVMLVVALLCLRAWVDGFLRSEDFRHFLDRKSSALLRADGHFQPLHWQDTEVYSDTYEAAGGAASPFAKLSVERVRARLDLHALWHHAWRVETLEVEKFDGTLAAPSPSQPESLDPGASSHVKPIESREEAGGFPVGWLPSRVEVGTVTVNDFSLGWNSGRVSGTRLVARPREGGAQNWEIDGVGGVLEAAHLPAVRLTSFNVKSSPREIFITRAEGQTEAGGHLELSGRQSLEAGRDLDLTANFDGLPITGFLPPDWRARLHGNAAGIVHLTGQASGGGGWRASGHADLRDGELEALPMLDQLATFTATDRYRRIPLQKGHADFEWTPDGVKVSNLFAESEGLLRVEGGFTVRGGQIDGTLQVGVARGSLRWIAVVGARVFDQPEHDGYVWTTTRLHGPVEHPSEDLSARMIAATQHEIIDKAQRGAETILDTAGGLLDLLKPR